MAQEDNLYSCWSRQSQRDHALNPVNFRMDICLIEQGIRWISRPNWWESARKCSIECGRMEDEIVWAGIPEVNSYWSNNDLNEVGYPRNPFEFNEWFVGVRRWKVCIERIEGPVREHSRDAINVDWVGVIRTRICYTQGSWARYGEYSSRYDSWHIGGLQDCIPNWLKITCWQIQPDENLNHCTEFHQ